ncbi:MAG: L,D-transpeptidase [Sphingomonas taxi]|uniref:L,D-transpeptidase n=1 Tax=Sphingomonas taxi TaxID=1549858 RepID=A0A2W4YY02_9SPHN|nr:MAG: L,D-transpeptidase [Sphingomonas taxi]
MRASRRVIKVIGRDRIGRRWRGTLITGLVALAATSPGVAQAVRAEPVGRFGTEAVSNDARDTADWVAASHDNQGLPFIVIDKVNAVVFAFDSTGRLRGTAPALLGMARGDASVPGIGQRKLATITPAERTTPAGRFKASLGRDFEQDILWIDYDAALSMHRVIKGRRVDDRAGRLASPTPSDNRISYGCVNVPPGFYDGVVKPLFTGTVGIVYILPETKPLRSVFAVPD